MPLKRISINCMFFFLYLKCFKNLLIFITFCSQAFSNILTKIGHYSTQEKCVEIILNYSMSEHIINAIFDENLLCNALKPVGRIGFNKITLNEVT